MDKAYEFYNENRLVECQALAVKLLEDDAIPIYDRKEVLILLGLILGDWDESNKCRNDARALYQLVRRWHREGDDAAADKYLNEIRAQLDNLDDALREDAPKEWQDEAVEASTNIVKENMLDTIEDIREELASLNMNDAVPLSPVVAEARAAGPAAANGQKVRLPPNNLPVTSLSDSRVAQQKVT